MNALRVALLPLSWLFALAVALRNKCYDWQVFPSHSLGRPTISVGNLSVGGTGKTPLVAYIARYFQRKGKQVAILSRGYKRKSSGFVLVSDGEKVFVGAKAGGDEPVELAQQLPGVIVAVDEKRARAGEKVRERFPVDLFVLDDGFQHRAVRRDLDIVTIPASLDRASNSGVGLCSFLIPAGLLREPLRGLRRANHIVFTRASFVGSSPDSVELMRSWYRQHTSADVSAVDFQVRELVRLSDGEREDPEKWQGKKVYLFSGIASPEGFFRLVAELGFVIASGSVFRDHYEYQARDIQRLKKGFTDSKAESFLTTMKDAARLSGSDVGRAFLAESPVYGLAIDVQFIYGQETFHRHLDQLIS